MAWHSSRSTRGRPNDRRQDRILFFSAAENELMPASSFARIFTKLDNRTGIHLSVRRRELDNAVQIGRPRQPGPKPQWSTVVQRVLPRSHGPVGPG
ncbi:hypothetical protein BN77_3785 [Rhizobium mesoamericanum STM3625]|uniref:Uncharacterized protein n=1 Tax=Rhizobium mesoamericanum STM3625 TaxID=1211777 RepID=K0Q2K9_9HYPH|nr:hypothetical protein BN77_3785 [Rhizobium mesoamericanum STM3625]